VDKGGKGISQGSAFGKYDHLHTVRKIEWQRNQQMDLCYATPSCTNCGMAKAVKRSVKGSACCKLDDIHSVGKAKVATESARGSAQCKHYHIHPVVNVKAPRRSARGLHYASTITYIL
jgi:predicted Zn-ribbon and HTH transcriptional regulator